MLDEFVDLVKEANNYIAASRSDFRKFLQCKPMFERIVEDKLYLGVLHNYLSDNLAGTREITPDLSSGPFIVLHGSDHASWAILAHTKRSRYLYLAPSHSISARITINPVEVQMYLVPDDIDFHTLNTQMELTPTQPFVPALNTLFTKDGQREVIDIAPSGGGLSLTIRVNTLPFDAFEWSFDRQTRRANQISSMRQFESNLVTIFDLLGAAQSRDSLEHLEPFTEHPTHFVRWKAIQTVGSIDREMALGLLVRAIDDEHPHVRAAARSTFEAAFLQPA